MGGLELGDLLNVVLVAFVLPLILKWQDRRQALSEGDMRKSEKKVGDETELSRILLQQTHESNQATQKALTDQAVGFQDNNRALQERYDLLSQEVLVLERKNVRLEGENENIRASQANLLAEITRLQIKLYGQPLPPPVPPMELPPHSNDEPEN